MSTGLGKNKLVHINQFAIKGQKGTGYEGPDKGEFSCRNCEYFRASNSSCGQKDMMEKSVNSKTSDGRIKVDPLGCCEYIDREGRFGVDKKSQD